MGKMIVALFFGLVIIAGGASSSVAHHAGGVEIGDLDTGSVVGQAFKELPVDAEIQAIEIGTMKVWYPPTTIVDFKGRTGGNPVVLKVTNTTSVEHGFFMTADAAFEAPSVLKIKLVLKPGPRPAISSPRPPGAHSFIIATCIRATLVGSSWRWAANDSPAYRRSAKTPRPPYQGGRGVLMW